MGYIYNIRVYGLFIQQNKILLSDEYSQGMFMTKFPGGGMEPTEGLVDCLLRECREEMNTHVKIKQHFYTTDFFIKSVFGNKEQLLSVYYLMEHQDKFGVNFFESKNVITNIEGSQSFRWLALENFSENEVTFPIDKVVAKKIKETYVI